MNKLKIIICWFVKIVSPQNTIHRNIMDFVLTFDFELSFRVESLNLFTSLNLNGEAMGKVNSALTTDSSSKY